MMENEEMTPALTPSVEPEAMPTEVKPLVAESSPEPVADAADKTMPTEDKSVIAETAPASVSDTADKSMPTQIKPLELPQQMLTTTWSDVEKGQYWRRVLTGDAATVPLDVQKRAGADDPTEEPEGREYKLLGVINRSWMVDHTDKSREEVHQNWPSLRRSLAAELKAGDDETELFTALSARSEDEERCEQARRLYTESYEAALRGKETPLSADDDTETRIRREAVRVASARRRELLPQADRVAQALRYLDDVEDGKMGSMLQFYTRVPELASVVHELAEMDAQPRAELLAVAASRAPEGRRGNKPQELLPAMWDAVRRGQSNLNYGILQGFGNLGVASLQSIGETFASPAFRKAADVSDKHLQVIEQLRRTAQREAYPIQLNPDASFAEELALEAAEATPGAGLAFCGGAGFGLLAFSGMGDAVAEARQRAPQGDQKLQLAAGIVGSAVQAGICMGLSRVGGRMLERSMKSFAESHGAGRFTLSALGGVGKMTGETAGMLLGSKAGAAADMGLQELAAQMDGTASNIDWRAFGDDMLSIEGNMREAARQLPYLLIGSGRMALHHFRNPAAVLGRTGEPLAEWGVPEESRKLLMSEADPHRRDELLRDMLRSGKRWSGAGFLSEAAKVLKLLQTKECHVFDNKENVRDFLQLPPESHAPIRPTIADISKPGVVDELVKRLNGGEYPAEKSLPFLQLVDTWWQRAYPKGTYLDLRFGEDLVDRKLTRTGYYGAEATQERTVALQKVVEQLDCLSFRFLLNTHSFDVLMHHDKDLVSTVRDTEKLRKRFIGKIAEGILIRTGGATLNDMDVPITTFLSNYYHDTRFNTDMRAWQRFVKPKALARIGITALCTRPPMGETQERGFVEACRIVRASHAVAEALTGVLMNHPDFETAISRGYSPQEAMTHLLHRELGERLPGDSWLPLQLQQDVTDRKQYAAENAAMMERYTRWLGVEPESRVGEDGETYWRVLMPDGHYTHWHNSRENAVNDVAAHARMRFLRMEQHAHTSYTSAQRDNGFDANLFTVGKEVETSYFDRLTARATADLHTLWQERPGLSEPGLRVGKMYRQVGRHNRMIEPLMHEDPEVEGRWLADELSVRSPYSLMQARFQSHWLDALSSGWLPASEAADFLLRRGMITERERKTLITFMSGPRHITHPRRHKVYMDPEKYQAELKRWWTHELTSYEPARNRKLAELLSRCTYLYCFNHLQEMPLPPSVKEWFGLVAFMRTPDVGGENGTRRTVPMGLHDAMQAQRWTHRNIVARMHALTPELDQMRADTSAGGSLSEDPFFPHIQQAVFPDEISRAEQGWSFELDKGREFRSRPASFWYLMRDPERAWKLLSDSQKNDIAARMQLELPEEGIPEPLVKLSATLREHPWLHGYDRTSGENPRLLQLHLRPMQELSDTEDIYEVPPYVSEAFPKSQFEVREVSALPEDAPDELGESLNTLADLRRSVLSLPYATEDGVWWEGRRYGGLDGELLPEMAESENNWSPREILPTLRRLFSKGEQTQLPFLLEGIDLSKLNPLPEDMFRNIAIFRTPDIDMAQVRLMPGTRGAEDSEARNPYVIHTFVGASLTRGHIADNKDSGGYFFTPLQNFARPDTDYVGHMLPFRGRENLALTLNAFMNHTKSIESLEWGRNSVSSNLELLMELAEDSRFDMAMARRAPHEYSGEEALAAVTFHLLASYEAGDAEAGPRLVRIHDYLEANPDKMDALRTMLEKKQLWQSNSKNPWTFNPTRVYKTHIIDHGYFRGPRKPYNGSTYNPGRRK